MPNLLINKWICFFHVTFAKSTVNPFPNNLKKKTNLAKFQKKVYHHQEGFCQVFLFMFPHFELKVNSFLCAHDYLFYLIKRVFTYHVQR